MGALWRERGQKGQKGPECPNFQEKENWLEWKKDGIQENMVSPFYQDGVIVDSWKGYGGGVAIQTNPIPSQIRRPTQLGTC